jgi:hypothetical protein
VLQGLKVPKAANKDMVIPSIIAQAQQVRAT